MTTTANGAVRYGRRKSAPGIHPTAVVEGTVGEGSVIGPHAYIGPTVRIGSNCIVGPGSCLGQDGFGYERVGDEWLQKPQSHGVVVGDDVHIGANTCIDRGSYRDTFIGRGTKIDNLCHIAHNVQIGENCLVIACSEISGSVELGDRAYVAPASAIREHLRIGEEAFVGLGSVVVSHIKDGQTVYGVPAKPH